jgi:hypothetical protein
LLEELVRLAYCHERIPANEHRFNDVVRNILMRSSEQTDHHFDTTGRCKRFDFIACDSADDPAHLKEEIRGQARRMALDPGYTAHIDRYVDNFPDPPAGGLVFGRADYVCIHEVWARNFACRGGPSRTRPWRYRRVVLGLRDRVRHAQRASTLRQDRNVYGISML